MDYEKAYKEALERAKVLGDGKHFVPHGITVKEYIFLELTESEDERIREKIKKCIIYDCSLTQEETDEMLAWLEKQKDLDKMIVVTPEVWDNAINEAFENGKKEGEKQKEPENVSASMMIPSCWETEKKEQNPAELELKIPDWVHGGWDDEYMINTVIGRYSLHAEVAKKRGDTHDYNLSKSMENWLRNVVKPLIVEKQKKPAEFPLKDKVFSVMNKLHELNFKFELGSEEERLVNEITSEVRDLADYSTEKPTEWKDRPAGWNEEKEAKYQQEMSYMPKPEKPAEWSEEDEKMIERLIRHTQKEFDELCNDRYGHQEIISDLKESCRERMRWLERLKSLRPQPKRNCKECAMFLCGECTRPHWKPSEEQMEALKETIDFAPDTYKQRCTLVSLYNDLKTKL